MGRIWVMIVFVFSFTFSCFAQEEEEVEEMLYHNYPTKIPEKLSPVLEGDFKLPSPLQNKAFHNIAKGIADFNLMYQYPLFSNFLIGAGFKFQYFQFADFLTNNNFSNSGKLFNYAPYGRLSYIKFANPRLFWQLSVKGGYSYKKINSFSCSNAGEAQPKQEEFYLEPQMGIHIFVDESLSFSLVVANYIGFNNFNPSLMCLSSFGGFTAADSEGNYNVFGIGFGFTYFFNKKGSK